MSSAPLDKYQSMRDFGATPEPAGVIEAATAALRFVVQEHHATALHWDLRLERDGVLASWALPKGVPADPRVNHLAVHTEDHPMQYLDFHGDIPSGNYGAGSMTVWDAGTYEVEKWSDREVLFVLHGQRVDGRYVLFQTRGKQWMIHRMDPPADPSREVWPGWSVFGSVLPVAGPLPSPLVDYNVEFAWGGLRVLAYVSGGRVQLHPDGALLGRFRELRLLGEALGVTEVVLDGSLIVAGADGRASAALLQARQEARSDATARRLSEQHPAVLMISDVLWLEGHSLLRLPYASRRASLAALGLGGPAWQVPASYPGADAAVVLAAARAQGLTGVVVKRLDRAYDPESADWIFVPAG